MPHRLGRICHRPPGLTLLGLTLAGKCRHQLSWRVVKNRIGIQSLVALTPLGSDLEQMWQALRADQTLTDRGVIGDAELTVLRQRADVYAASLGFAIPTHTVKPSQCAGMAMCRNPSNSSQRAKIFPPRHRQLLMDSSPGKAGGYVLFGCGAAALGRSGAPENLALPDPALLDRSIELGTIACLQALTDAGWSASLCAQSDTALLVATSKGPILRMLEACEALRIDGGKLPEHLAWHVAMGPAALQTVLTGIIKPGGPIQTHVAACAGALVAVQRAWMGIMRGEFRRAIIVAADASIHPLFEHSFENLGVFAKPGHPGAPGRRCRPFGVEGDGFFISEAAAAICVEGGDGGAVAVERCFLGADATHLLAIDSKGTSLERGLRRCAAGQGVAFVHAHAAGTHHDQVELAAIRRACGAEPAVFSHKRWMGHTLGASGLVGLVISTMCHAKAQLPDGQRISSPARSITIGQGFGGHIGMCVLTG